MSDNTEILPCAYCKAIPTATRQKNIDHLCAAQSVHRCFVLHWNKYQIVIAAHVERKQKKAFRQGYLSCCDVGLVPGIFEQKLEEFIKKEGGK